MKKRPSFFLPNIDELLNPKREVLMSNTRNKKSIPHGANTFKRLRTVVLSSVPKSLYYFFKRPINFWFLAIAIIHLIIPDQILIQHIILLSAFTLIYLFQEILLQITLYYKEKSVNNSVCLVWDSIKFADKLKGDICPGDIVVLKENEQCPADVLIIATGNIERNCYADVEEATGEINLQKKEAFKEIQSLIDSLDVNEAGYYLNTIEGSAFIDEPCQSFTEFNGKFRLHNAHKSVAFDISNVLLRNSTIRASTWVFGLTLYTGQETKLALTNRHMRNKSTRMDNLINRLSLLLISVVLIISLVHFIISGYLSREVFDITLFLRYILLYSTGVPLPLLFILDACKWIISICNAHENSAIKINNPKILEDLGQIEYILMEKNKTISNSDLTVRACLIGYSYYILDKEQRLDQLEEGNLIATEIDSALESLKKLVDSKDEETFNFLRCMATCNNAYPQQIDAFNPTSLEDRTILDTAKEFGVNLIHRDSKKLIIMHQDLELEYRILAYRDSSGTSKKCRILITSQEDHSFLYYVRGSLDSMREYVDGNSTKYIEDLSMSVPGIRIVAFAYKKLTVSQVEYFMYNYNNARKSPVNKEGRVQAAFEELESDLTWLGFVGIDDKVNPLDRNTIKMLRDAGIKIWLSSSDSEETTLSIGLGSDIIEKGSEVLKLTNVENIEELHFLLQDSIKSSIFCESKSISDLGSEMNSQRDECDSLISRTLFDKKRESEKSIDLLRRSSLHPLISRFSNLRSGSVVNLNSAYTCEAVDYVLVMDGKTMELAVSDKETLRSLIILLFMAKAVSFFNMLPNHKKLLGTLLNKCFCYNPAFLAISTQSDLGLCHEANVGVNQLSDISIQDFSDLKELLLFHGLNFYYKSCKVVRLSVFANSLLLMVLFLYNYLAGFTATWMLLSETAVIYVFFLQIVLFGTMIVFDDYVDKRISLKYPELYSGGIFNQELSLSKIVQYFVVGLVLGGFSFLFTYLALNTYIDDSGHQSDKSLLNLHILLIIYLTLQICTFFDASTVSLQIVASHIIGLLLLIAYVLVANYQASHQFSNTLTMYFSTPFLPISCIVNVLINSGIYYCVRLTNFLMFPTSLESIERNNKVYNIFNLNTRQKDFEQKLGKVYADNSLADEANAKSSYVVHPVQLKFESQAKEKEYNAEKAKIYRKHYRIYLVFYLLTHFAMFLYAGLSENTEIWQRTLLFLSDLIILILFMLQFTSIYTKSTINYINTFYILSQFFTILSICLLNSSFSTSFVLYPLVFLISFSHWWITILSLSLLGIILDLYYKSLLFTTYTYYFLPEYSALLISIFIFSAIVTYVIELSKREEYMRILEVNTEMAKATNVLELLLPQFVISRVKEGVRYISDDQGTVTVLFCNICQFEELTKDLTPQELTNFLDELFGKFDQLCELVGVTKIETVGKTYMASAGLKDSDLELDPYLSKVNHARRVVELGLGMIRIMQKVDIRNAKVHVKIGINSGPVRAGVVGYHKPQFSLVGDTVNTASRMASTLKEYDSIQISGSTYELMHDAQGFHFTQLETFVKGKGMMETYIVRVKTSFENMSPEVSPINDTVNSSLRFQNISAGFLSTFSSLPGVAVGETIHRNRSKKKTAIDIEWRESVLFKSKASDIIDKIKFFACTFHESRKEAKFRHRSVKNNYYIYFWGLLVTIAAYVTLMVVEISCVFEEELTVSSLSLWSNVSSVLVYTGLWLTFNKFYRSKLYGVLLDLSYFYPIILAIVSEFTSQMNHEALTSIKVCFQILLLTQCSTLLFKHQSLILLIVLIIWVIFTIFSPSTTSSIVFIFTIISLTAAYHKEIKLRVNCNLKSMSEKELKKIEDLLTQMVPAHAYQHLKQENTVVDKLHSVTVLYADIVGFTAWSSDKTPDEVVSMLNQMFSRFDKMSMNHHVYKVHTIGDCYVAMSFVLGKNRDFGEECENMLLFAEDMIKAIEEVNEEYRMGIGMRIGVHTGDIIAGITGKSIVRYDIYGNDVYIANAMESNGIAGRVAVSQSTMQLIKAHKPLRIEFEEYKSVELFDETIQMYLTKFK